MDKRLTRTEMLFSLGFLFMLICAVGAFFYGVKIGTDRTEERFAPSEPAAVKSGVRDIAYQQQDLVSFYHTVFLPFREFVTEWQAAVGKIGSGQTTDPSSAFRELSSLAQDSYAEVMKAEAAPANSPLLGSAQNNLLKSLKLFGQAADRQVNGANALKPALLLNQLAKDAYYKEAVSLSVQAQQMYYASMLKWSASVDPDLPGDFDSSEGLDLATWKKLSLVIKLKVMADILEERRLLTGYYPQDLAARLDQFIASGQPAKLGVKTVQAAVDLLLGTDAVRPGDFSANRTRFYADELLPQLPFFIS